MKRQLSLWRAQVDVDFEADAWHVVTLEVRDCIDQVLEGASKSVEFPGQHTVEAALGRCRQQPVKLRAVLLPKSGKDQYIPINADARQAFKRLKALAPKSELVCPVNDYDQHRDWWLDILNTAAVTDFRWHDLHHTFASRLVMNGVDIVTVNKLMRHETLPVTMRYAHLADKHLASAIAKLEECYTG